MHNQRTSTRATSVNQYYLQDERRWSYPKEIHYEDWAQIPLQPRGYRQVLIRAIRERAHKGRAQSWLEKTGINIISIILCFVLLFSISTLVGAIDMGWLI